MKPLLTTLTACALLAQTGCMFKTPDGRAMKLGEYDSVIIESVEVPRGVAEPQVGALVKGYTAVAVLKSKRWKLGGDFDLDAFARTIEEYSTTQGTVNGKPVEPVMTREEFLKDHAKERAKWEKRLGNAGGARPIRLRIRVTDLRFPEFIEDVVVGTNPRMRCKVDVYDGDTYLGSGDMEAIKGLPGMPFAPTAMASRAAMAIIFDSVTRKTVMQLADEVGRETVDALTRAK